MLVTQSCQILRIYGLWSTSLFCPWNSPVKNTRVGGHALLQGIFLTHGLNPWVSHIASRLTSEPPGKLPLYVYIERCNKNIFLRPLLSSLHSEFQPICLFKSSNISRKVSGPPVCTMGSVQTEIWPYSSLDLLPKSTVACPPPKSTVSG